MRMKLVVLLLITLSITACIRLPSFIKTAANENVTSQVVSQESAGESKDYAYASGVFLAGETASITLDASAEVINGREDIRSALIHSQRGNHIIFVCNITYYSGSLRGYGNQSEYRLCHMPPEGEPRLIKAHAYGVMEEWSPEANWFVFAGAPDAMSMICEQHLYAYHSLSLEVVDLMPDTDARICGISHVEWHTENGETWLTFDAWNGGQQPDSTSYVQISVPFDPLVK